MKKVLITGVNSYVGNSFESYINENYREEFEIDKISLRDGTWENLNFSKYDSILHVAGIAHRKETKKNAYLYYEVNRDLTYQLAEKAKKAGVKHFVFLSSMSVYGLEEGVIDNNTPLNPKNHYGKSKLMGERLLNQLNEESFKVAILRPPMIYGSNCPGNYESLRKLAILTPVFFKTNNFRSMIYIKNLSLFLCFVIQQDKYGNYHPQNIEYICVSNLVESISRYNNKNLMLINHIHKLIRNIKLKITTKLFKSLVYKKTISNFNINYNKYSFEESIKIIEEEKNE